MTNQQTAPQQRPQYREDYKAKKLLQRIEAALKAKESSAATAKN